MPLEILKYTYCLIYTQLNYIILPSPKQLFIYVTKVILESVS